MILSGGHVPTQNRFFEKIRLRDLLKSCEGVVLGISAGSMNSADEVYAQPEEEGEAVDPAYRRFLPGLGLTKTNLLPHYQENKDDVLDGRRIYADIACPDSMGRTFYAIPDGSYLLIDAGKE
jgi:dipeptidase E